MEEKEILTKDQIRLLGKIGQEPFFKKHFYLGGGTPLAAFYLHHRYSEDLDFFSEREIDASGINAFFKKNKEELGIIDIDFQQSFNRNLFFLTLKSGVLKMEFTYFPFVRIEKGKEYFGVETDSILDIAVNKLFTIYQRTKARDYIDLYCICREYKFTLADLIKKARIKFDTHIDPIQLGTQFTKAREAEDYPRMILNVPPEKWQDFFIEEAKKLTNQIIG